MATIKRKLALLKELLTLKEVIDLGQIHAAANRNGIKHSNMSKMISNLEARFKAPLLIRSSSGSEPTNTSRQLYTEIEKISSTLNEMIEILDGPDELTGCISIWTEEGFVGCGLLPYLAKLYAKHPKIRLDILTNRHTNMSNPDITILDAQSLQKLPGKALFKFKTKAKFYATPTFLVKHGIPENMEDMLENFDLCIRQKFLQLPECNFLLKRAKCLNTTADSASIIYQLVHEDVGISLVPEWCIGASATLIEVPNIDFAYEYVLTGVGNPLTIKSPKVQAFLEFFYEFCQEHQIPLEMFE